MKSMNLNEAEQAIEELENVIVWSNGSRALLAEAAAAVSGDAPWQPWAKELVLELRSRVVALQARAGHSCRPVYSPVTRERFCGECGGAVH